MTLVLRKLLASSTFAIAGALTSMSNRLKVKLKKSQPAASLEEDLVLCTAFRGKPDQYPNLTVRRIPKQVLSRCEWNHDDYSLRVENLPKALPNEGPQGLFEEQGE